MKTKRQYAVILSISLALSLAACSGTPPTDLGIQGDGLKPCPATPNCVSSLAPVKDDTHFIPALSADEGSDLEGLWSRLPDGLKRQEIRIIEVTDTYLRAEAMTQLMRFVDDLEFYKDRAKDVIQVRSASRLGRSDFGKNRERIEQLRADLR